MSDGENCYLIALGSNMRHVRRGRPRRVLEAALREIGHRGAIVVSASPIVRSRPIGPSQRDYANAAAVVASDLAPLAMLAMLKELEADFDRKAVGSRWRARTLDCDIVLWSQGAWCSADLIIPHPAFRERKFVLAPAVEIAPDWRDPITGQSIRQLLFRLRHQGA